jgi:hypothetical protein
MFSPEPGGRYGEHRQGVRVMVMNRLSYREYDNNPFLAAFRTVKLGPGCNVPKIRQTTASQLISHRKGAMTVSQSHQGMTMRLGSRDAFPTILHRASRHCPFDFRCLTPALLNLVDT